MEIVDNILAGVKPEAGGGAETSFQLTVDNQYMSSHVDTAVEFYSVVVRLFILVLSNR